MQIRYLFQSAGKISLMKKRVGLSKTKKKTPFFSYRDQNLMAVDSTASLLLNFVFFISKKFQKQEKFFFQELLKQLGFFFFLYSVLSGRQLIEQNNDMKFLPNQSVASNAIQSSLEKQFESFQEVILYLKIESIQSDPLSSATN